MVTSDDVKVELADAKRDGLSVYVNSAVPDGHVNERRRVVRANRTRVVVEVPYGMTAMVRLDSIVNIYQDR